MKEALNYKDLPVVQRSFELVREVDAFVKTLPATPQGRTVGDQLFRAATSIGANIAEGRGRDLGKEYQRFLRIARASANEADYWLRVAYDCQLLHDEHYQRMLDLVDQCLRMLSSMISRLQAQQPGAHSYGADQQPLSREHPATYRVVDNDESTENSEDDEVVEL